MLSTELDKSHAPNTAAAARTAGEVLSLLSTAETKPGIKRSNPGKYGS